jgi:D-alanyl-D-alanine carboxypeptidase
MFKVRAIFLGMSLLLGAAVPAVQAETAAAPQPAITGQFGVAIDATNGEILYDKNAKQQAYPASITKVLTAILLDENVKADDKIIASATAAKQDASNQVFLLKEGEQLSKEDALKAMMIKSSNDVAYAVAEKVSGNIKNFAKIMNKKAKEIGAENSNFVTPNGLHNDRHVTTPYDMALIAKEAMKHPDVLKALGTKEAVIRTNQRELKIVNRSKIHENPIVLGGKTGYTNKAKNTLVEILKKDGKTVIAVVMKTTKAQEYNDIVKMGNYSFAKLHSKNIVKAGQVVDSRGVNGHKVSLLAAQDYSLTYVLGSRLNIKTKIETINLTKGFKAGDIIGNLDIVRDGKVIKQIPLKADKTVNGTEKIIKQKEQKQGSHGIFIFYIVVVGVSLAVYRFTRSINKRYRKRIREF